jgi:protein TonB
MIDLWGTGDNDRARATGGVRGAIGGSIAVHAIVLVALAWIAHRPARHVVVPPQPAPEHIVWIASPGPSGGGGGSPAPTPPPPKPAPPTATRLDTPPAPVVPIEPPQQITPVAPEPHEIQPPAPAAVADASTAGAADAPAAAGGGTGSGTGSGNGAGAGPGTDRGFGGGAYQPGNGVTSPIPIRRGTPQYTVEAMRARAQGIITVQCVVEPDGQCGEVRILHEFEPPFGLDREALDAARRWRFRPGMRNGEPVPVLVNLEIEFNIR